MTESKTRKRPKTKDSPETAPDASTALHIRGVPIAVVEGLDAMVDARRAELLSRATDALSRRVAASLSRNDLIVDLLSDAVSAHKKSKS